MQSHHSPQSPNSRGRAAIRSAALALMLLAAAVLFPSAQGRANVSFTFEGGGFGHSVGMSQFGAYGMALEGYSWEQILTHYYTGVSVGDVDPVVAAQPLWIGLTQERTSAQLTVFSTSAGNPVPVIFNMNGQSFGAQVGETVTITDLGGGRCRLSGPAASIEGPCWIDATWDGVNPSPSVGLELGGCSHPDWNSGGAYRPCRYAQGILHVRPDDTIGFDISVELGVEAYLLGISEMPYFWGTNGAAALQAQAVAARSYALHRAAVRGEVSARPWCWCQLYDTTVDQYYVGWGQLQPNWTNAVASTAGKVLYHPSATIGGRQIPIQAFYSSSTFGYTEASEHGFSAALPYLRPVDDHWSRSPQAGNPHARWTRSFTGSELANLLPGMSTVTGAQITACSTTGAALEITFSGQGGPRAFPTRELRTLLSLRSMQVFNVGSPPSSIPPCSGPGLDPIEAGGPVFLAGYRLDDDNIEDSRGDGNGMAACGELLEVWTDISNSGGQLAGLTATVSTTDSHLRVVWNRDSNYPDLQPGATGANANDWDIAVADDTPDGHIGTLTIDVGARNGGPWSLQVSFPVSCAPTAVEVVAPQSQVDIASVSPLFSGTRFLRRGVRGGDVADLQQLLTSFGFETGPIDGIFGPLTDSGVRAFQRARGLLVDGIVGPQTRTALTPQ